MPVRSLDERSPHHVRPCPPSPPAEIPPLQTEGFRCRPNCRPRLLPRQVQLARELGEVPACVRRVVGHGIRPRIAPVAGDDRRGADGGRRDPGVPEVTPRCITGMPTGRRPARTTTTSMRREPCSSSTATASRTTSAHRSSSACAEQMIRAGLARTHHQSADRPDRPHVQMGRQRGADPGRGPSGAGDGFRSPTRAIRGAGILPGQARARGVRGRHRAPRLTPGLGDDPVAATGRDEAGRGRHHADVRPGLLGRRLGLSRREAQDARIVTAGRRSLSAPRRGPSSRPGSRPT